MPKPLPLETVAEMWASYQRAVMPQGAPPILIQECRRAFYAGAAGMFSNAAYRVGSEDVTEEEGMKYFDSIEAELVAYMEGDTNAD